MTSRPIAVLLLLSCACVYTFAPAVAQEPASSTENFQALEAQSRAIKAEVLDLEAELSALEQEIRYPAQNRWTVFVTAEDSDAADLQQIELQVNGRVTASHQYSADEQNALRDGGAHRLYIGSLPVGQHPISIRYVGENGDQIFDGGTAFVATKNGGPQLLELHWQPGAEESLRLTHDSFADAQQ